MRHKVNYHYKTQHIIDKTYEKNKKNLKNYNKV